MAKSLVSCFFLTHGVQPVHRSAMRSNNTDKCQLSLIDPRDGTVLQKELDDYCDRLVVERRSSEVLST